MTQVIRFECPLPHGIHARPATALEEVAAGFAADICLVNERSGRRGDVRSVLSLVALDVRLDDPCRLEIDGPDETPAQEAITVFLRDRFPGCDEVLPPTAESGDAVVLPPVLRDSGAAFFSGTAAVGGIGRGELVRLDEPPLAELVRRFPVGTVPEETAKLEDALIRLQAESISTIEPGPAAAILQAQRAVGRDPELHRFLRAATRDGTGALAAVAAAEAHFTRILRETGNPLLRERALDVRDVCRRLARFIAGPALAFHVPDLPPHAVGLAESLTPDQLLALDRTRLRGLVIRQAGTTSHTVILARAFGIPTVTGVAGAALERLCGEEAVADGEAGVLVTRLTGPARRYYQMEQDRLGRLTERLTMLAHQPGATRDGHLFSVCANVNTAEEVAPAVSAGAEGVGLFRTEMLFAGRAEPPSEEEQVRQYLLALNDARGRPVTIRTLDVGGDKPLPYLNMPAEANPFLGCRGVRLYREHQGLVRTQLRALVRVAAAGSLRIMVPMVARLDEFRLVRRLLDEEQERCRREGLAGEERIPLGIMVEVPAVAFALDHFAREADFFSLGTNDLLQYFTAVDRSDTRMASGGTPLEPAFIRFLHGIMNSLRASGKPVTLCGEMAGTLRHLPLLVGLGLDGVSVAGPAAAGLKTALAQLEYGNCRELLLSVLDLPDTDGVLNALTAFVGQPSRSLLEDSLVRVETDCSTKAEAIKLMADMLQVVGRTERPRAVEEAVWARETVYSTGLGHGIAIPHGKSAHLNADSLGVLKLRTPVEWGSLDGAPVHTVILLAMRDGDGADRHHLRVFSRLARQLVHEEFRRRLDELSEPAAIRRFLEETLERDRSE